MNPDISFELFRKLLREGKNVYTPVLISSNNSFPLLQYGDLACIKPLNDAGGERLVGRLVAIDFEKKFIIQRAIKYDTDKTKIYIKADHSYNKPTAVDTNNVIGFVIAVKKKNREVRLDRKYIKYFDYIIANLSPRVARKTDISYLKYKLIARPSRFIVRYLLWTITKI